MACPYALLRVMFYSLAKNYFLIVVHTYIFYTDAKIGDVCRNRLTENSGGYTVFADNICCETDLFFVFRDRQC